MKGIAYGTDFLVIKEDEALIKDHLNRLLLCSLGERINNYNFGSSLKEYLFNFSSLVLQDIQSLLVKTIERKMPEIIVNDFSVEDKGNETMTINLSISKRDTLETILFSQDYTNA